MNNSKFRILVSTDNHLGYNEKDGIRSNDSFKSFEEVMFIAQEKNVDFVLLAGDLFHENRPTISTIHECTRILRKYVHGEKNHEFEIVSNPEDTYATCSFKISNFHDANMKIKIPIFSIHGNHDDPLGHSCICALDILHSAGFINLFGKHSSAESIVVKPILMNKGSTKLAIYGLSAIREERMYRMFANDLIKFDRPVDSEEYFNIILVHQNRAKHGPTNHLPENFIPDFFDLVIWGHEHECRIIPEFNAEQNFHVIQPGSSVATSLSEGEAVQKAVGILEIKEKEFKLIRENLLTVRPFVLEEISAESEPSLKPFAFSPDSGDKLQVFCTKLVDKIIKACFENTSACLDAYKDQNPSQLENRNGFSRLPAMEPLIRLKIDTSNGFESFSSFRFSQAYVGRVANLKDIVTFNKKKEKAEENAIKRMKACNNLISDDMTGKLTQSEKFSQVSLNKTDVLVILESYLDRYGEIKDRSVPEKGMLSCLTLNEMKIALTHFVEKENNDAINFIVEKVFNYVNSRLKKNHCPEERIQQSIWLNHLERYTSEKDSSRFDLASLVEFMKLDDSSKPKCKISDTPEKERKKQKMNDLVFSDSDEDAVISQHLITEDTIKKEPISQVRAKPSLKRSVLSFEDDEDNNENITDMEAYQTQSSISSQSRGKRARGSRVSSSRSTATSRQTREVLILDDDDEDDFEVKPSRGHAKTTSKRDILIIEDSEDESFNETSSSRRGRGKTTSTTRGTRARRARASKKITDFL